MATIEQDVKVEEVGPNNFPPSASFQADVEGGAPLAPAPAAAVDSAAAGDESKTATTGSVSAGNRSVGSAALKNRPSMHNVVSIRSRQSGIRVPQLSFAWRNRTVKATVKGKNGEANSTKTILNNACGAVRSGEMLAIMGPSGSGKTTLLNTLAGIAQSGLTVSGEVLVGGKKPDASFRQHVSYVQQEDSLMGVLTVRETFEYAAKLSGVKDKTMQAKMVDNTLELLGLDVCEDVRIGDMFFKGISGGQRRRVSIGVELMKQPSVIILDEPTSGLDSASAFHVISNLRNLAQSGRTIIATIHQPSSEVFALFDKVCILTRGDLVYFGGADVEAGETMTETMVSYFDREGYPCPAFANAADHALRLVNTDFDANERADIPNLLNRCQETIVPVVLAEVNTMDAAHATFAKTPMSSLIAKGIGSTSICTQFMVLAHRHWVNNLRNPGVFWIRLFMYSMLSFMIGTLFVGMDTAYDTVQDRISILFYIAAFMVFMSIAVLPFFIQTRAVFARERRNGAYDVGPYVISQFFMALPGLAVISLLSSVIVYFMTGFHDGFDRFIVFFLALFLSLVTAEAFMSVMAALVPHYIIGMALGAGAFGMFMLMEGFFVQPEDIKPWWIWAYYLGFHTYSFRAFMVNEFDGLTFDGNPLCGNGATPVPGSAILKEFEMEDAEVWLDLLALGLWAIFYQLCFYCVLKYKYRMRVV